MDEWTNGFFILMWYYKPDPWIYEVPQTFKLFQN